MQVSTPVLEVTLERAGPADAPVAFLLHGWPDDVHTWDKLAPAVQAMGFQTVTPYLRGYGPTRFRSADTMRSGQLGALGQDLLDLADALGIERFAVIGHDWGARAAYIAAAVAPQRVTHCVALSVGWGTNDPGQQLSLKQARNYWYHWYFMLERGARLLREDRQRVTHYIWETWGPPGWFTEDEFSLTAGSFDNPDWAEIVLHSFKHRWGLAEGDARYAEFESRLRPAPVIGVPTLMIHGGADPANDPSTSANRESLFSGPYRRIVLDGVGHFPNREAPQAVAQALRAFFANPAAA
jgi:pimeloyl-ACP methyl ester carboxylesterase